MDTDRVTAEAGTGLGVVEAVMAMAAADRFDLLRASPAAGETAEYESEQRCHDDDGRAFNHLVLPVCDLTGTRFAR